MSEAVPAPAPAEPAEHLDREVLWLWRVHGLIAGAIAFAIGNAVGQALDGCLALLVQLVLPLLVLAVGVGAVPPLRYARWRIELDDERLDLREGAFSIKRTLVPMRRVQHVDSQSDVLERAFGVATVTVHTAGGKVVVPGLKTERAAALARRISDLARVDDD